MTQASTKGRRQLGCWVDAELYKWAAIQAKKDDRYLWELVEEALREYRERREGGRANRPQGGE